MNFLKENLDKSFILPFDIMKIIYEYADPMVEIRKQIKVHSEKVKREEYRDDFDPHPIGRSVCGVWKYNLHDMITHIMYKKSTDKYWNDYDAEKYYEYYILELQDTIQTFYDEYGDDDNDVSNKDIFQLWLKL